MRTAEQISALYNDRRKLRAPIFEQMRRVQARTNGEMIVVPFPGDVDKRQMSMVTNLVQQGVDAYGQRIGEVTPNLACPPVNPRHQTSIDRAAVRKKANLWWWKLGGIERQLYRRGRFYAGYGAAPVTMWPDTARGVPQWRIVNPLGSYPAPTSDPDELCPPDHISAVMMPLAQIKHLCAQNPDPERREAWRQLVHDDPRNRAQQEGAAYNVLTYNDAEQISLIALNEGSQHYWNSQGLKSSVIIAQTENRAGMCLSTYPGRITLDRLAGQFDGVLGLHDMRAKIMALELQAALKQVHPDKYLIHNQDGSGEFISGPHPGSSGLFNEVKDATVQYMSPQVGQNTWRNVAELERAERQAGGITAEMGGESPTNVRTGARGGQVYSAQVDPTLREAHTVFAAALAHENYIATKITLGWFADRPQFFDVNWDNKRVTADYTPSKDFDSCYTDVTYPQAGMDQQNLTIMAGQLGGTGMASMRTLREMHPAIRDADFEHDQLTVEGLEAAAMSALQTGAADGSIPLPDVAAVLKLVRSNEKDIIDAIIQVHEDAQKRQAAQAPAEGVDPAALAVDPASPEAQPGIAQPGQGAEAGTAMPETPPSLSSLAQTMNALRNTSRTPAAQAS